jgi:hypothetical protein
MLQYLLGLIFDTAKKNSLVALLIMATVISWATYFVYAATPELEAADLGPRSVSQPIQVDDSAKIKRVSSTPGGAAQPQTLDNQNENIEIRDDGKMQYRIKGYDQSRQGVEIDTMSEEDKFNALD